MQLAPLKAAEVVAAAASVVDATPETKAADQCNLGVCEEVILAGKEADISGGHPPDLPGLQGLRDCPDVGIGKRRGRLVNPLGTNNVCLVAKGLTSRKRRPACLTTIWWAG